VSRITDLIALEYAAQGHYCADPACQKCSARFRWLRRKGWRTGKTTVRKNTERK
jgi:hypothetical protein